MTRVRFGTAFALLLCAAAAATAQPAKPTIIQFKQFGSTPEQFYQSSLTRWTGQLALDLEAVKADVSNAKVTAAARAAINAQIDNPAWSANVRTDLINAHGAAFNVSGAGGTALLQNETASNDGTVASGVAGRVTAAGVC